MAQEESRDSVFQLLRQKKEIAIMITTEYIIRCDACNSSLTFKDAGDALLPPWWGILRSERGNEYHLCETCYRGLASKVILDGQLARSDQQ